MERVDQSALRKVVTIGDQNYAKSVLEKYIVESYTYLKELESLSTQGKEDEVLKLANKFGRTSKVLGGREIGDLCSKIVEDIENKAFSISDIKLLSEAKDFLISRLNDVIKEYSACRSTP